MKSISVKGTIRITIDGKQFTLTREEAKQLLDGLREELGEPREKEIVYVDRYPWWWRNYPYMYQQITYSIVTNVQPQVTINDGIRTSGWAEESITTSASTLPDGVIAIDFKKGA